jgi:hypothetical protein
MKIIVFFAIVSFLFPAKSQNKTEIDYQEIDIKCTQSTVAEQLIRSDAEYQKLLEKRSIHPDCDSYTLPEIDFETYSLIGIHYLVAGCKNPDSDVHVYRMPDGSYQVKTSITQYGICKRGNHVHKWILIPKIDNADQVVFEKTVTVNRK